MARVACVMMQRDEGVFLEPWLAWHGALFGFQNLYVLDNGSVEPAVLLALARAAGKGVHVTYATAGRRNYAAKGECVGAVIRRLQARGAHDFYLPTDCDEFVILRTARGFSADPAAIHAHLDTLSGARRTLRIGFQIYNNPRLVDCYVHSHNAKTFYAQGSFAWTDHGHHADGSLAQAGFQPTAIAHAHFHNRGFAAQQAAARRKWSADISLEEALARPDYAGQSHHLLAYFRLTAAEYYAGIDRQVQIHFPQLRARLAALGAPLAWEACDPDPDLGADAATPFLVPVTLDEELYLRANPDVAAAGLTALHHWMSFGRAEARRLAPDEPAPP